MPFREKLAWISIAAHAVVFGGYFFALYQAWDDEYGLDQSLDLMVGAVVMLVFMMVALSIAAALLSPKEVDAPADERERLIELKAERIASYVLSTCLVLLIATLLLNWNGYLVACLLLGAMVIGEITKAIAQIAYYRTSL